MLAIGKVEPQCHDLFESLKYQQLLQQTQEFLKGTTKLKAAKKTRSSTTTMTPPI